MKRDWTILLFIAAILLLVAGCVDSSAPHSPVNVSPGDRPGVPGDLKRR